MNYPFARPRPTLLHVLALAIALLTTAHPAPAQPGTDPTLATTDAGNIRGAIANDILSFKGVPFAAPPTGNLRWRPPQPVTPWNGIRDALALSPDPLQPIAMGLTSGSASEDCLYLNIWRPAAPTAKPLPVMVWIYGGGLVGGGASSYPGEFLARQGIIVVTFNYRVGRLGFFAHPALAKEAPDDLRGNYGYMDQLAALQWVQRNIASFGGDPANVTIAGESAGGGSVLVLLTSPMARGLFHRAILQSPGIPTPRAGATPMRPLAAAESIAVNYASANGIKGDDQAALDALRKLPAETLCKDLDAAILSLLGGPDAPGLSHSIIDGRLVPQAPDLTLRANQQAMVPIIIGATDYEMAASTARSKDDLFLLFGDLADQAHHLYDTRGNATLADVVQKVIADQVMIEPGRYLAETMTRARQPAYFYRFAYVADHQRPTAPGATHGSELIFTFDAVSAFFGDKATPADREMGHAMSRYWTNFIKTGDPNKSNDSDHPADPAKPAAPTWPPYNPATSDVFQFTNTGPVLDHDPLRKRLDLWRTVWTQQR